jgi:hypothetical protein
MDSLGVENRIEDGDAFGIGGDQQLHREKESGGVEGKKTAHLPGGGAGAPMSVAVALLRV